PPGTPTAAHGAPARRGPRRSVLAIIAAVVLALGIGTGVWYINSGQFTQVPYLLNKTQAEAKQQLDKAGLDVRAVKEAYSDAYKLGTVMDSDPDQGARIRDNGKVTLTISKGPRIVAVPDLKNVPLDKARQQLKNKGLEPGKVARAFSEEIPQGSVISTDPPVGTKRKGGAAIALTVSKGAAIEVPDVIGESVEDAKAALQEEGLKAEIETERVFSEEEAGTIARQHPGESAQLARGDKVTLTVSKGPRMIEVPDVVGKSKGDAEAELTAAGFKVDIDQSFPFLGDEVTGQSVEGGEEAPEGSTITLKIKGI
ncbi:PASTA domain-containing protein, partial [Streptomyces sp. T-3]|nr:PASTA domain-containing protein [Streptomyces sp. T-3]